MNLMNMLMGSMTSQSSVESLSGKTGLSQKQVSMLISLALPLLLKHMTSNASSQQGAASLLGALGQHGSKKSMAQQIEEADAKDGQKIVSHIFGDNTSAVMKQLAGQTGLSTDQVSSVLSNMSPAMMSGISAATTQAKTSSKKNGGIDLSDGLDMSDVMGIFGAVTAGKKGKSSEAGGNDLLKALMKAF